VKFKDVILVDCDDFKRAVSILEDAGIEVCAPAARLAFFEEAS